MPVIVPLVSELNFTPSSTGLPSDAISDGVVDGFQMLHGQIGPAPVVNDQV